MLSSVQVFQRKLILRTVSKLRIGHPEDRILAAVGRYHFLTITQLMRLLGYSPNTKRTVEKRLAALVAGDYLLAKRGFSQGPGLPPAIYVLGPTGRKYLEDEVPLRRRFRPSDAWEVTFLKHVLGLNDVLIAAERLAEESAGAIWQADMQHEQILQERPFAVTLPDHRAEKLVPDAWLDLRFPRVGKRPLRECYWVEFDRGTERQDTFRAKIRKIISLSLAPESYEERFGTNNLTVAIATLPEKHPELRRDMLLAWIRDEMRRRGSVREDLFFVTSLNAAAVPAAEFFCQPVWSVPFTDERVPLIELPEGGA